MVRQEWSRDGLRVSPSSESLRPGDSCAEAPCWYWRTQGPCRALRGDGDLNVWCPTLLLRGLLGLVMLWSAGLFSTAAWGGSATVTDRYFEGLLNRGLIELAEGETLRRLENPLLRPRERTEWRVRLAEAYSRHAEFLVGEERQLFWERASQTLRDLLQEPTTVRRELVLWQQAQLRARQAEVLRWEGALREDDPRFRRRTTALVQANVTEIRQVIEALDAAIAEAASRTSAQLADGELSSSEVRELRGRAEALLAAALVDFVELSEPSIERSAAMHEADGRLKPLASGWLGDPVTWEAKLQRIRLMRIMAQPDQALSLCRAALVDHPIPEWQDRFVAEQVRLDLAAATPDVALGRLLDYKRTRGILVDELQTLQVEGLLRAIDIAHEKGDSTLAKDLWTQSVRISGETTGAWGGRSRVLLQRSEENQKYGVELARSMRMARATYLDGEASEAARFYQSGAARATELHRPEIADEFDYTAASILLHLKEYQAAANQLAGLVARSPMGLKGAEGDLLRAFALGQLFVQQPTRSNREAYTAALEEHRTRYATSPTAGEATWMLATYEESRNQWTRALELYGAIPVDHAKRGEASVRMAVLYGQILDRLRELGHAVDAWEDAAITDLTARFAESTEPSNRAGCDVGVRLARLFVRHRERRYVDADRVLADVVARHQQHLAIISNRTATTAETTPDDWEPLIHAASQLRIVSLAGQGKLDDASQVLTQLSETSPRAMLSILLGLGEMAEGIAADQRQGLGRLQLQAARRIETHREHLTAEELRKLDESLAEASVTAGEATEGIRRYRKLREEHPDDQRLTRILAALLQVQPQREAVVESRQLWVKVLEQHKQGSREWLTARYEMAACAVKLGEAEEARKLLGLTRVIYPELGGPDLKARYDALEQSLPKVDAAPSKPTTSTPARKTSALARAVHRRGQS